MYLTRFGSILTPDWGTPSLQDIAYTLSKIIRYNGASRVDISVAAHSILTYELAKYNNEHIRIQLLCLLHDAAESAIGDVPSPFKNDGLKETEKKIWLRILNSFGVEPPKDEEQTVVDFYDKQCLRIEAHVLGAGGHGFEDIVPLPTVANEIETFKSNLANKDYDWGLLFERLVRQSLSIYHEGPV